MAEPSSPTQESLRSLYHETWAEVARLRDAEWKITYYFVTLNAALTVLFLTEPFHPLLTCEVRTAFATGVLFLLILALYQLIITHRYLTQQRNIRREIEEILGLYEPPSGRSTPVLPREWKGTRISHSFQTAELV